MHRLLAEEVSIMIGGRSILSNCFFALETGETAGLFGRNGSGKTTFLRILYGTQPLGRSNVRVDGVYIPKKDRLSIISMLPQRGFVPDRITVKRAISLFFPDEQHRELIMSDRYVMPYLAKTVGRLSGGEKRYLEVALILNHAAPFVFLDEPFAGMSPLACERIQEQIQNVKKEKGVLITDHVYRSVIETCDRLLYMANGAIITVADPDELRMLGYLPRS
jgi:ABC-type multidrug transport system ATPase subunit